MKYLLSNNKKLPAINKIKNSKISNKFLSIEIEAPRKAKGTDAINYGVSNFILIFFVLKKFIELPLTTIILQINATIGKI